MLDLEFIILKKCLQIINCWKINIIMLIICNWDLGRYIKKIGSQVYLKIPKMWIWKEKLLKEILGMNIIYSVNYPVYVTEK